MSKNSVVRINIRWLILVIASIPLILSFQNCSGLSGQGSEEEGGTSVNEVGVIGEDIQGFFNSVNFTGEVFGWAKDGNNEASVLAIDFYVDGTIDFGTYVGSTVANREGFGPGDGHYFLFQIPAAHSDGNQRMIYAYNGTQLIPGFPQNYISYSRSQDGRNYFQANLSNFFATACVQCHGAFTGDSLFKYLADPPPTQGGTATSNYIYRKMSGGIGHSGGRFCSSAVDFPCPEIAEWWRQEFN